MHPQRYALGASTLAPAEESAQLSGHPQGLRQLLLALLWPPPAKRPPKVLGGIFILESNTVKGLFNVQGRHGKGEAAPHRRPLKASGHLCSRHSAERSGGGWTEAARGCRCTGPRGGGPCDWESPMLGGPACSRSLGSKV